MTKQELSVKACQYAVLTLIQKGSHAFGTKENGKFETVEWSDVLEWLNEVEEQAGERKWADNDFGYTWNELE